MKGKITALLMAACVTVSALACGNSESAEISGGGNNTTVADQSASSEPAASESNGNEGDMAEITVAYLSMGALPPGLADVEEAINEITEKEINTHVTLEVIESGNYAQQINLKMSAQEPFDLMVTMPAGTASFNNMVSQKQFMEISDLLEDYGQGILDTVGEMIRGTTVDGRVYGVTAWSSLVTSDYIVMRTDVLEDLGLLEKAENMTALTEYEEILQAVKDSEKWNYLAGLTASDMAGTCLALSGTYVGEDKFSDGTCYDQLGDANKMISINPDGSDPTVVNNFKTEEYQKMYEKMKEWNEKGYVYGDVTTQNGKAEELIKSDVVFSFISHGEIGVETLKSNTCGMPMTCVKMITMPISTSTCTKWVWAVPVTSKEPEAAVTFLNMMYTDSRIANLLAWGVENVHYQVKDGVAYYMDGEDANSCAYHTADFLYGNQFLVLPWDGQPADFREQAKAVMESAEVSAYLGFACDTTAISGEISAVSNVISEYLPSIDSGIAEPESYDAFLKKLDDSGMPKIIEEYQTQLDEWLEMQK